MCLWTEKIGFRYLYPDIFSFSLWQMSLIFTGNIFCFKYPSCWPAGEAGSSSVFLQYGYLYCSHCFKLMPYGTVPTFSFALWGSLPHQSQEASSKHRDYCLIMPFRLHSLTDKEHSFTMYSWQDYQFLILYGISFYFNCYRPHLFCWKSSVLICLPWAKWETIFTLQGNRWQVLLLVSFLSKHQFNKANWPQEVLLLECLGD